MAIAGALIVIRSMRVWNNNVIIKEPIESMKLLSTQ